MFSKRLLAVGLVVVEPGDGGMASPPTSGDQFQKCEQGRFNTAAGLCVSEGAGD